MKRDIKTLVDDAAQRVFGLGCDALDPDQYRFLAQEITDYLLKTNPEKETRWMGEGRQKKDYLVDPQAMRKWYMGKTQNPYTRNLDWLSQFLGYRTYQEYQAGGAPSMGGFGSQAVDYENVPVAQVSAQGAAAHSTFWQSLTQPLRWMIVTIPLTVAVFMVAIKVSAITDFFEKTVKNPVQAESKQKPKEENAPIHLTRQTDDIQEIYPITDPEEIEKRVAEIDARNETKEAKSTEPIAKKMVTITVMSDFPFTNENVSVYVDGKQKPLAPESTFSIKQIQLAFSEKAKTLWLIHDEDTCPHFITPNRSQQLNCP